MLFIDKMNRGFCSINLVILINNIDLWRCKRFQW